MPRILIVGGGYAGFYTARRLERLLRPGEAEIAIVDPLPYLTYQPFLPEVAAGSIEPRHALVSLRRHLKRSRVITARVTGIDHARRTATLTPEVGDPWTHEYDELVVTAGAITRTFPIPGLADTAIGMKNIEEAVAVRDRVLAGFDRAQHLPEGPQRQRLLTFVVVGGGFAGIETFGELLSMASSLVRRYPGIEFEHLHFHLVEAMGRVMPEVSEKTAEWVVRDLRHRGGQVHLNTQLSSVIDGVVELSTGERFEADTVIWTAGVAASPMLRATDLPLDERGRLRVGADLRVTGEAGVVEGAWGAGDAAAVPDLSGGGVGGYCVPNAQHALRQGKRLARNLVASLRGEALVDYRHDNLGAVAGTGLGHGVFQSGPLAIKGLVAWAMHRGYHGLAIPTWERKLRVFGNWALSLVQRRDLVSLEATLNPREAFASNAVRPKPAEVPDAAPAPARKAAAPRKSAAGARSTAAAK